MLTSLAILADARRPCPSLVQMACSADNARYSLFLSPLRCPQGRILLLSSHKSLLTQVPMLHCEHRPCNLTKCSKPSCQLAEISGLRYAKIRPSA